MKGLLRITTGALLLNAGHSFAQQKIEATPEVIALCSTPPDSPGSYFTPNGDGKDDVFSFKPLNMRTIHIVIFDKERNIVFTSDRMDAAWNGNDPEGKAAKEGTYYYMLDALGLDGRRYAQQGTIRLSR